MALIIPDVTVLLNSKPIGLPIAYTLSPTLIWLESPKVAATKSFSFIFKIDKSKSEGLNIETKIYQYKGVSEKDRGLRGDFIFEKFVETKDSIHFFNLNEIKYVDNKHLNELKLKKGEVYIKENENNEITSIVIKYRATYL